jgi:hypothetical protein
LLLLLPTAIAANAIATIAIVAIVPTPPLIIESQN